MECLAARICVSMGVVVFFGRMKEVSDGVCRGVSPVPPWKRFAEVFLQVQGSWC